MMTKKELIEKLRLLPRYQIGMDGYMEEDESGDYLDSYAVWGLCDEAEKEETE
jgi:hypothetical protein